MSDRRSLPELAATAAVIVLIWMLFAINEASESYRVTRDTGYTEQSWLMLIGFQTGAALMWAFVTPAIVFIAERFPLVKPFRWRNVAVLLALTPLLAIFRTILGSTVMQLGEGSVGLRHLVAFAAYSIDVRLHRNIFLVLVVIGVVNLILAHRAAAASERKELAEKKKAANDEVQRLRAAMQPRFLFAALDAVSAQVTRNPHAADRMLVELGGVLRTMLEFEKRSDVTVAEELELVEQCLRLERTRTAGGFSARVNVGETLLAARIPPLLLHSVIESAVLVEDSPGGSLTVDAWAEDGRLTFLIADGDPSRAPRLEATRARLRRAYADLAWVYSRKRVDGVVTTLNVPLSE